MSQHHVLCVLWCWVGSFCVVVRRAKTRGAQGMRTPSSTRPRIYPILPAFASGVPAVTLMAESCRVLLGFLIVSEFLGCSLASVAGNAWLSGKVMAILPMSSSFNRRPGQIAYCLKQRFLHASSHPDPETAGCRLQLSRGLRRESVFLSPVGALMADARWC